MPLCAGRPAATASGYLAAEPRPTSAGHCEGLGPGAGHTARTNGKYGSHPVSVETRGSPHAVYGVRRVRVKAGRHRALAAAQAAAAEVEKQSRRQRRLYVHPRCVREGARRSAGACSCGARAEHARRALRCCGVHMVADSVAARANIHHTTVATSRSPRALMHAVYGMCQPTTKAVTS